MQRHIGHLGLFGNSLPMDSGNHNKSLRELNILDRSLDRNDFRKAIRIVDRNNGFIEKVLADNPTDMRNPLMANSELDRAIARVYNSILRLRTVKAVVLVVDKLGLKSNWHQATEQYDRLNRYLTDPDSFFDPNDAKRKAELLLALDAHYLNKKLELI